VEKVFPQKYSRVSQPELAAIVLASPALYEMEFPVACLQEMLARDDVSFLHGRALYPRYYEADGGESFTDSFGYKVSDQGRLVFTMMHQQSNTRIVFPMDEPPMFFPHTADVTLVYGNERDPWFVLVQKDPGAAFYVSDDFDVSLCR
jgi:hypothetical protein